jgi:hypothetical protein
MTFLKGLRYLLKNYNKILGLEARKSQLHLQFRPWDSSRELKSSVLTSEQCVYSKGITVFLFSRFRQFFQCKPEIMS